jgi:indole-3-glycerol phosphate synthase
MILDELVKATRSSLARRKKERPLEEMERLAYGSGPVRNFEDALRGRGLKLIAEVKRASPSKGWLCPHLDAADLAREYARGGAAAMSVLTEAGSFKGSFEDMSVVRDAVDLPILCKDFVIDSYQICEARSHGADAVLLIAAILPSAELRRLTRVARELGMSSLVEVHSEQELEAALDSQARLVGINNRNLEDFSVDLRTTSRLRPLIPSGIAVVSESGIHSRDDVIYLEEVGVDAVLVGEVLVTSSDAEAKIKELLGKDGES